MGKIGKIRVDKIGKHDAYYIKTIDKEIVINGSIINGEHLRFIKQELIKEIEKKWLYKRDKKVFGQRFIVTVGETRWKEFKKKHTRKN